MMNLDVRKPSYSRREAITRKVYGNFFMPLGFSSWSSLKLSFIIFLEELLFQKS